MGIKTIRRVCFTVILKTNKSVAKLWVSMNGKQFKNNVFAPTKKTQKNLSKIFFLSFQSMMKRLKHGSLVFCCFLALLWLYAYLSNTFPSSENTSVIQEQDTKLDVGPKDSIEKYLDEILE